MSPFMNLVMSKKKDPPPLWDYPLPGHIVSRWAVPADGLLPQMGCSIYNPTTCIIIMISIIWTDMSTLLPWHSDTCTCILGTDHLLLQHQFLRSSFWRVVPIPWYPSCLVFTHTRILLYPPPPPPDEGNRGGPRIVTFLNLSSYSFHQMSSQHLPFVWRHIYSQW